MDNKTKNDVGKDIDFLDEHGEKATIHIESATGYKVNMFNNGKYRLVNSSLKNNDLIGANKNKNFLTRDIGPKVKGTGLFTRDIGIKSSGFAQVASLSFIVALAGLLVMYVMFRY